MKYMFFFTFFFFLPCSFSQENNDIWIKDIDKTFVWIRQDNNLFSGKCYAIDIASGGQKYKLDAKSKFCRPEKIMYLFNPLKGYCYEGDEETEGKNYIHKVKNIELCKPEKTSYEFLTFKDKTHCYEVDSETLGKSYYKKVKIDLCQKGPKAFAWKAKNRKTGSCYQVIEQEDGDQYIPTKKEYCQPQNPIYTFLRTGPVKGECLEQDPEDWKNYSYKTLLDNCRPEKTLYFYYKAEKSNIGHCYEVDEKTRGDHYIKRVKNNFCYP